MMVWVFRLAVGFILYTLAGYQILLWIISRFRRQQPRREDVTPAVTVIIVAHNEAATIAEKIQNTLAFDYPKERLEVVVGSDGSQDKTVEIVRSFAAAGVKLVESPARRGKHHLQMLARDVARGEVLVFTDASIRVEPHVLRKMVSHFADPAVGCVCSVDQILESRRGWRGEHFYVYGEMGLRHLEAQVGSLVSLSGSLFAVRRAVGEEWHPDMSSDFFLALHAVERGYRAVIDPECRARLGMVRSQKAELTRKVRTIVHGLVVFFAHLKMLNLFRYGLFSWQLLSHKLFRWLLPFAVLAALVSNIWLWNAGSFYQVCLLIQLAGYAAALVSHASDRLAELGVFKLASFFVMGNVATLMAWWKFCQGEKLVFWEPSRRG
jgi:cellulose synthase/poly-beta-1,6-N-acetylglucosamine synthase-like glycosyltransferase